MPIKQADEASGQNPNLRCYVIHSYLRIFHQGYSLIDYKLRDYKLQGRCFVLATAGSDDRPASTVAARLIWRLHPQFLWISLWTGTGTSRMGDWNDTCYAINSCLRIFHEGWRLISFKINRQRGVDQRSRNAKIAVIVAGIAAISNPNG
jgi:hypothetical protein